MYIKEHAMNMLKENNVVPVVVIEDENQAVPLAEALLKGGCSIMEVTMRTAAAIPALKLLRAQLPQMKVGIGTVTNVEMFKRAAFYGAQFIVSPGSSQELFQHAVDQGVPYLPGVMTSSEIMVAREFGFPIVKFFPANLAGGINAIKTYGSVYSDVLFFPTGGINSDNYQDFLMQKNVVALGGTWIASKEDISNSKWSDITARVAAVYQRGDK